MRKKIITIIFLLIALSLLTIGLIQGQVSLIDTLYEQMANL
ncbi:MAG: hypothetical protein BAJALOKI2v1_390030 [Promethearchaeota archaeon]|nr:MAG: hypothetical protein BAJALOKI2v1_390030 [Candidatus Lokiarchaeota archaeon]